MSTNPINPQNAYYIKLGIHGEWEKDCLKDSQTIRLGYLQTPHELCLQGKWDEVQKIWQGIRNDVGSATRDKNQIQVFYESDEKVLWVTFFGDRFYWCFSKPEITLLSDKSKSRPVIGQSSSNDLKGKTLQKSQLSGALLRMEGFRGTICKVKELNYLVQKINGVVLPEIEDALEAKTNFEEKIEILIRKLTWQDFELLVDLLFHQAGWQRVAPVGKTEKTIDLDLYSPINKERFLVQVKSSANLCDLQSFIAGIIGFQYNQAYFLVHTPLDDFNQSQLPVDVEIWGPKQIAQRVVLFGLSEWVISKVS